ncbi:hypothetical protein B1987_17175 [Mycobacterium kansasii]|uniref:DUF4878 domain-containing protein n=1 Tax=Mycobacterium attenuatum TaxID=2341086 RepID=A0A498PPG8_9MYCO|nr:hypothetical protein [Mycobacterium attenuatum]ORB85239.1 hypothetical protein B1987_17175 [Mycobacterium kansasii]VBA33807.1 hypothetical protein LAUMK136_00509 [Mycobacterium attenuatum]VBA45999.1 hypothetical protein LAUMK191_00503 [Mycobacterium attenuatum]VBA47730.1 hypothetical protein LAUMK41_00574 [Mycobacterium attenuatum]
MPNAPEPDRDDTQTGDQSAGNEGAAGTEGNPPIPDPLIPDDAETATVVISKSDPQDNPESGNTDRQRERRFTAPGFDAKETQVIATSPEPATEVFHTPPPAGPPPPISMPPKTAMPQSIPPRGGKSPALSQRNWGWVLAIVVIVLAVAAIAILGTVLFTRTKHSKVSQEDQVRQTIQSFDVAIQTGDLTTLRSITCGTTRDGYVDYDEHSWSETYRRVSAAKQYPVIASIDQVVVNGQHAEANVTTFMAYDPQVRSTRSLDLQFRDDQWKICQSPSN